MQRRFGIIVFFIFSLLFLSGVLAASILLGWLASDLFFVCFFSIGVGWNFLRGKVGVGWGAWEMDVFLFF